jgi:ATP-dependent protease ClpP protease subunit
MYRVNQKRKYCLLNNNEDAKDKLAETFAEGLEKMLGGESSKKKHKSMSNLFNQRNTNEEVYRENNHIYFRTDVTVENCDILLQLVREFEDDMKALKSDPYLDDETFIPPKLYIHLTTYGGDLYASFLVYDSLKKCKHTIVTVAEGYVASAGTVMMLGGTVRQVQKSAVMMIHQLRTVIGGKFDEIEEDFKNSKMDMKRLINMYHEELGGKMTKKELQEVLTHDVWWEASICVKKGLCHVIV